MSDTDHADAGAGRAGGMFRARSSPLRTTPAPSPIEKARQNDFRELTIDTDTEHRTWADELGATTPPAVLEPTVELLADEWTPITVPVGSVTTVPTLLLGDDPARRSAVLVNIGTEDLQLGTQAFGFANTASVILASVFVLKAGASLTLTSTRPVWVRAPVGTAGGISVLVERGARRR